MVIIMPPLPYPNSPPVTDKYLLVEDCAIRTEERHRIEALLVKRIPQADMVGLALLLRVSIVTSKYQTRAGEGGLLNTG